MKSHSTNSWAGLRRAVGLAVALAAAALAPHVASAQGLDRIERERALQMLGNIKSELKKNYYDPGLRGMDVEARFKAAEDRIKQAASLNQAFGIIAQVLLDLDDSHTKFFPPSRPEEIEYGWRMQMIGDECYVTAVKPGSDAEAQGLKPGDRILQLERFRPTRKDFWKMRYYYNALSPRPGLQMVVQSPGGEPREVGVKAKVRRGSLVLDLTNDIQLNEYLRKLESGSTMRHRYYDNLGGSGVFVWKMPGFYMTEAGMDEMMGKVRKASTLVLDLRGNPGGAVTTLQRLIGHVFDKDMKVADFKARNETKPTIAKTRGKEAFTGKIIVLIDSESGSSSELFARLMQLEKRGVVIGERSAGAVMRSMTHSYQLGAERLVMYFVSITNADAIMSDGKSLEHAGVTPDEQVLPTAADLAAGRDPAMARALELAGVKMDPAKAGALFPYDWENE
jgi:carboxyl-terminal processing protease